MSYLRFLSYLFRDAGFARVALPYPTLLCRYCALFIFAACCQGLQAQQLLDEAVITANRFSQKQAQIAKVLTVIPDSVLRRHDAQTLAQLLNAQTGLWIVGANAAPGTNQNVYMRGANIGYVSILLNGIPVNDPSAPIGNFDINVIPIGQIERVEILKGAQSVLYGSDAVAGVINLIPRTEKADTWRAIGNLSGGSFGTINASAGLIGKTKGLSYGAQYNQISTSGFSAAYDSVQTDSFDKDGMRNHVARVYLSQAIGKNITLRGVSQYAQYRSDLDAAAFKDDKDYTATNRHFTAGIGFDAQFGGIDWHSNYAFYDTERLYRDDSTDVPPFAFSKFSDASYRAKTHFAELYGSRKIGNHVKLLLGGDYRAAFTDQHYLSVSDFGIYEEPIISSDSANVAQYSSYSSLLLDNIAGFNIELGGRFNHHRLYGNNMTYSLGLSRFIGNSLKLFAGMASGFRAPSLYQLFSPYGNRNLKPETALHIESGLQWWSNNGNISARVLGFGRNTDQIIVTIPLADFPYARYTNQNKQRDYGIEADIALKHKQLNTNIGYAFVTGNVTTTDVFTSLDTTYNNLIRRPKHRLTLTVGYAISPKLYAELRLQTASKRLDLFFDENTFSTVQKTLNGFALLDLHISYQFTPDVKLFADLRNLSNSRYFELTGYNTRRFNFDVGLSVDIGQ